MSPEHAYHMQYRDGGSSSSSRDIIKIKISKIQADSLRTPIWLSSRNAFVKVQIQDEVRETVVETVESDLAIWDDELHFDTRKGTDITFTILIRHRMRKETTIGWVTEKLNSGLWNTNSVERRLCHDHNVVHTHIHFKIELLPSTSPNAARRQAALKERISNLDSLHIEGSVKPISNLILGALHLATNDVHSRSSSPANDNDRSVVHIASAAEALQLGGISFSATWDPLLSQVKQFTNLVQKFAEIHPYAKFAFSVLTAAFRVVNAQKERDDKFRGLIHKTTDVFDFLNRMKVADLDGHKQTMKMLALQTTECAYFIRDYTKRKSFIVRVGASLLSGTELDGKIAEYERKFKQIKTAFRTNATLNIEIAVVRIAERMETIDKNMTLNDLPYAEGVRFDRGRQCLPGTCEKMIEKITEWVNDIEKSRVLVLSGDAGTGKSTIAHTISRTFDELNRLGSSFFFPRDGSQPYRKLFSTITRDLADLESHWKAAAFTTISQSRALRKTGSLLEQYEEFILKPAKNTHVYVGPILIVIDALDASTHFKAERDELLSLLFSRTTELPRNFRILITTRGDEDILDALALENRQNVAWWKMADLLNDDSRAHDIGTYFSTQLSRIPGVEWNEKRRGKLIAASGGDFAWAVSTCAWVKEVDSGHSAADRLLEVLHEEPESKGLRGILKTLHLGPSSRPPSRPSSADPHRGLYHFPQPPLAVQHSDDKHDDSFLRKTPGFKHSDEVKLSPVSIPPYLRERQTSEEPLTPPFSSSVRTVSDDEVNSLVDSLSTYSYNPHENAAALLSEPSNGITFPWTASPDLHDYRHPETGGGIGFDTQNIWVQPLNVRKAQYPKNEGGNPPMPQPRPHKAQPPLRYVPGMPGENIVDLRYQSYDA
ncbi:hypothetical protein K438DRAFT_1976089 [Mycena galopus ATCC 62051]|nr:hypothetical protein K438DRAFT_1976089 [Mycena galopus ATCC 62051]